MDLNTPEQSAERFWFVGAAYGRSDDQTKRFVEEGIWHRAVETKGVPEMVKSIQPGDCIAIKSSYPIVLEWPTANDKIKTGAMTIKAIGTVKENLGDGHNLKVDWKLFETPRKWYFYVFQSTVHWVTRGDWRANALIDFTFNDKPQDLKRFVDAYTGGNFTDDNTEEDIFKWAAFYMEFADKLLSFKNNRKNLISHIYDILKRCNAQFIIQDKDKNGKFIPLDDICPFTVFGLFNRDQNNIGNIAIAQELAKLIGVKEQIP